MSLSSMTAFSRVSSTSSLGTLTIEIKTVNHRYLEISCKLPDAFKLLESQLKTLLSQKIKRGKADVFLQWQHEYSHELEVNESLLKQFAGLHQTIQSHFPTQVNFVDVLHFPGVLQKKKFDVEAVKEQTFQLFSQAVDELCDVRAREGDAITQWMLSQLKLLHREVSHIQQRMPQVIQAEREQMVLRLSSLSVPHDANRLEQEMVYLMQKADIEEECQRLQTHLNEVERIVLNDALAGRRLDFLMQELNREANTIASKSLDVETTQSAVEIKALIEQLREQIQNVE